MRSRIFGVGTLSAALVASAALAESPAPKQQFNATALWFENWHGLSNATLTVSRPDGKRDVVGAVRGTPVYRVVGGVPDGRYSYELSAATDEMVPVDTSLDNGRGDAQRTMTAKPFYLSGSFEIIRGVIGIRQQIAEE